MMNRTEATKRIEKAMDTMNERTKSRFLDLCEAYTYTEQKAELTRLCNKYDLTLEMVELWY